ncbi:DUF1702 family protein [Oceanobacillus sp. FSL K6-0127]|uniref:DUF1702 family protein n=1 Tax=Oceanobacillus sp. FSL K6-0127 TaxID=2921420 RepID=UPI0030EC1F94
MKYNLLPKRMLFFYSHYFKQHNDSFFINRFKNILRSFFIGAFAPLVIPSPILLNKLLERTNSQFYRGFSYEGTGIGFAIKSFFRKNKASSFESKVNQLSPNSIYQYYVGLGWLLHFIYRYKSKKYADFGQSLNHKYSLIMFDGVGFKIGLFQYFYSKESINLIEKFTENQKRVCYQGFGRSLWFISRFNWDTTLKKLEELGETFPYRNDILSGVGLAVAYSKFDDLLLGFKIIDYLKHKNQEDFISFLQGFAYGLEARRLQDPYLWRSNIDNIPESLKHKVNQLIDYVYSVKNNLDKTCNNHNFYMHWVDGVRQKIKENVYV